MIKSLTQITVMGEITISECDGKLTGVYLPSCQERAIFPPETRMSPTPLLRAALAQINEYFAGKRREFTLPLAISGTAFMTAVWRELTKIPYGKTATYGEIAARLGKPRAARAVGGANNRNPLPLFIPCHRVIGANGNLVGFAGGIALKEKLLSLEKNAG